MQELSWAPSPAPPSGAQLFFINTSRCVSIPRSGGALSLMTCAEAPAAPALCVAAGASFLRSACRDLIPARDAPRRLRRSLRRRAVEDEQQHLPEPLRQVLVMQSDRTGIVQDRIDQRPEHNLKREADVLRLCGAFARSHAREQRRGALADELLAELLELAPAHRMRRIMLQRGAQHAFIFAKPGRCVRREDAADFG